MQKRLPVNFVIMGYGHIGKRHADILTQYPESNLVAIVESNIRQLDIDVIKIPTFDTIENLIKSNLNFDAVVIATPNGLHKEHAIAFLNEGKHVIIEKPIALSTSDAESIYSAAALNHRKVFVVFQNRFSPISLWLKDVVAARKLGKIFMIQLNCFWNRDHRYYKKNSWHGTLNLDGGTLYTQFSHYIDALHWLFGDLTSVKSELYNLSNQHNTEFEDSGLITFNIPEGGKGAFAFTTAVYDKNLESSLTIIAEHGTVKIGGQYMEKVLSVNAKNFVFPSFQETAFTNHERFLYDVVDRIRNNSDPFISQNEVLNVINLIESMYESALVAETI